MSFLEIYMEHITDLLDMNAKGVPKTARSSSRSGTSRQQSYSSVSPVRQSNNGIGGKISPLDTNFGL